MTVLDDFSKVTLWLPLLSLSLSGSCFPSLLLALPCDLLLARRRAKIWAFSEMRQELRGLCWCGGDDGGLLVVVVVVVVVAVFLLLVICPRGEDEECPSPWLRSRNKFGSKYNLSSIETDQSQ